MSDVALWTPTHGQASAGRPARTYIHTIAPRRHRMQFKGPGGSNGGVESEKSVLMEQPDDT